MPGYTANPGGRPKTAIDELRARYSPRLPEFFDRLVELATNNSQPPMVQLAAIRLALDHLIGKPQISIDAVTTKVDIGAMYLAAMKRANAEIVPNTSHIVPSADAVK
jgi:hypothetical protein